MKRTICFSAVLCFFLVEAIAQKRDNSDLKGVIYDTEKAIDVKLLTQGWAADVYFGTLKTYCNTRYYSFGIGYLTHLKENKSKTEYVAKGFGLGSRHFVYGKQNYAYTIHGGLGMKHYYT
jgi:hypothetical protein